MKTETKIELVKQGVREESGVVEIAMQRLGKTSVLLGFGWHDQADKNGQVV